MEVVLIVGVMLWLVLVLLTTYKPAGIWFYLNIIDRDERLKTVWRKLFS